MSYESLHTLIDEGQVRLAVPPRGIPTAVLRIMDQPAPRAARLQNLRDRWFSEPLVANMAPLLLDDPTHLPPANAHALMTHPRVTLVFSSLAAAPDVAGLSPDAAKARDMEANAARFGVADPATTIRELGLQFDAALSGAVDPDLVKKGFVVLETLREHNLSLAARYTALLAASGDNTVLWREQEASHAADAAAIAQAEGLVEDLAGELGISLPINRGVRPKR